MTSKEYVIWLKGFVEACHEYAPTPKQWDALKDKLVEVTDMVNYTTNTPIPNRWSDYQSTMVHYKPYNPPYTTGGEADYITKETHNED